MSSKSTSLEAIVIKRLNTGETDRLVTLLSKKKGKILVVAKGVRKLKSSKASFFEPGNLIKAHLIITKSLPILTEAILLDDLYSSRSDLKKISKLSQILEIIDNLFVEEAIDEDIFESIHESLKFVASQDNFKKIKLILLEIIKRQGFLDEIDEPNFSITDFLQELTNKKLRSFDFYQV